jgi:hypothetical protein
VFIESWIIGASRSVVILAWHSVPVMPPDRDIAFPTIDEIVEREGEREGAIIGAELQEQVDAGLLPTADDLDREAAQFAAYLDGVRELAELAQKRGIADPFSQSLSPQEKENVWQLRDELVGRAVYRRGRSLLPMFAQLGMDRRCVVRKSMERGFRMAQAHRGGPRHVLRSASRCARPRLRRTRRRTLHRDRSKPRSDPSEPEPPRRRRPEGEP